MGFRKSDFIWFKCLTLDVAALYVVAPQLCLIFLIVISVFYKQSETWIMISIVTSTSTEFNSY